MSPISVKEMLNRHLGSEAAFKSITEISNGYREGLRGKALKQRFSAIAKFGNKDYVNSSFSCIIAIP